MPLRVTIAAVVALLALTVGAQTATAAPTLKAPKNVKAFLLRVTEPDSLYDRTFPRTPAFTWSPVAGAKRYAVELTTSSNFAPSGTVWEGVTTNSTPVIAPDLSLPWITGSPYSLYARVRAIGADGREGAGSTPYGFNMRWRNRPRLLDPQFPGLVRWTPIEGATAYEVWLYGAPQFLTTTNVADEREFYGSLTAPGSVTWRVRAVRELYGTTANGLPRTSYGPWSNVFTNLNPPFQVGELNSVATVSDVISTPANPKVHELTPAFTFTGNYLGSPFPTTDLFHVYVSTDDECANPVYWGAVVASPAYAPRLPTPPGPFVYGKDGPVEMLDGTGVTSVDSGALGGSIDLWDSSWPGGGYYWTVIPLIQGVTPYRDSQLLQDVCRPGIPGVMFGKIGKPVVTGDSAPYVSGLSPDGKLVSAKSGSQKFYGFPFVAWEPVYGAQEYEVQWSHTLNPWRPASAVAAKTAATAFALPLTPGRWYYRVRGLNHALPARPEMTWSKPVLVRIAKPKFKIVKR